jgi:hypothetical protein
MIKILKSILPILIDIATILLKGTKKRRKQPKKDKSNDKATD